MQGEGRVGRVGGGGFYCLYTNCYDAEQIFLEFPMTQ